MWRDAAHQLLTVTFLDRGHYLCINRSCLQAAVLGCSSGFSCLRKQFRKKKVGGVLVITCLGQLQLSVHVIEHLHSELEPAGQKAISLSLRMEAPRWYNGALTLQDIWKGLLSSEVNLFFETHTLLMSVPAARSSTSSFTSRFGGISVCCKDAKFEV